MKNLICLFNKDTYDRRTVDTMKTMSDDQIYRKAQSDLDHTDIYTMDDFQTDFNDNRPWMSPENYYAIFVEVPEGEVNQWLK